MAKKGNTGKKPGLNVGKRPGLLGALFSGKKRRLRKAIAIERRQRWREIEPLLREYLKSMGVGKQRMLNAEVKRHETRWKKAGYPVASEFRLTKGILEKKQRAAQPKPGKKRPVAIAVKQPVPQKARATVQPQVPEKVERVEVVRERMADLARANAAEAESIRAAIRQQFADVVVEFETAGTEKRLAVGEQIRQMTELVVRKGSAEARKRLVLDNINKGIMPIIEWLQKKG